MVSKSLSHKQARPDGMCLMIPGMQEAKVGCFWSKANPVQKQDPIWKISKEKWAGDMVQVVEYLPNKCKALSSNPVLQNIVIPLSR
jgi:hypothetical protein